VYMDLHIDSPLFISILRDVCPILSPLPYILSPSICTIYAENTVGEPTLQASKVNSSSKVSIFPNRI
jgi:hypothetical protein